MTVRRQDGSIDSVGWGIFVGASAAGLLAATVACSPHVAMSACDEDRPCDGRGLVCDLDTLECVAADVDTSSTKDPAPPNFTDEFVPFHRGEICLPLEVRSGEPLPVLLRPCLHPCVAPSSFEFRHAFECVGSRCEAYVLGWVVASSGAACPPEAFGQFDPAQCQYSTEIGLSIATETTNGPISGTLQLEVPFLTNDEMAAIVASSGDSMLIDETINKYPADPNRRPNGQSVEIRGHLPIPPDSCADGACDCYPIGF